MTFRKCNKAWTNLGKNRSHKNKNYENKKDNDKVESLSKRK